MARFAIVALLVSTMPACGNEPVGATGPAKLTIEVAADSIALGESILLAAVLRDARGSPIAGNPAVWSSEEPEIVDVNAQGVARAIRPGVAKVVARVGSFADTAEIRSVTSSCPQLQIVKSEENGYWGTYIQAGSTRNAETASASTEYRGVPLFWASGIVYGVAANQTVVGYYYGGGQSDLRSGVCLGSGDPMHSMSLLQPRVGGTAPPVVLQELVVVQDQWAFRDPANDDYLLFRYTFTNIGSSAIVGLRIGAVADYDPYGPEADVAKYDPNTEVASVVSADSIAQPVIGGMVLLETRVAAYRSVPPAVSAPSRAEYFDLLAPGIADGSASASGDVKQIVAAEPVTLAPGESMTFGYALIAGETRMAFEANVRAARAKAASVWVTSQEFGALRRQ